MVALGNNSRLNVGCPLTLNNVKVTSTSSAFNNHRGVSVYGQSGVSIDNCIFEYGYYGIYAFLTYGGAPLTVTNSTFQFCRTGLFSNDKGVTVGSCQFLSNTLNGWKASAMSFPSQLTSSTVTQTGSTGVEYISAGTGLLVKNSSINSNALTGVFRGGISYGGTGMLTIRCSSVSNNGTFKRWNIQVTSGADLNMSSTMVPKGGQVSAVNSIKTIDAQLINMLYLNQGYNDLRPASVVGNKVVTGAVKNNCLSTLQAARNRWKNAIQPPTPNVDYMIGTYNCNPNQNIIINDPTPFNSNVLSPPACLDAAQLPPPPKNPNAAMSTPLEFCPNCPSINTSSFSNVKLNDAVKSAMNKMEIENAAGNDLTAVNQFYEILTFPIQQKHERFDWLNTVSYTKMKEALGNAFSTGRTTNFSLSNICVQKLLAVQDSIIKKAKINGDSFTEFYTTTDKAFVYRLINKREKTLELLDGVVSCMALDSLQNAFLSESRKIVFAEYLVLSGRVKKENFENLLNGTLPQVNSQSGISVTNQDSATQTFFCAGDSIKLRPNKFAATYLWDFGNSTTSNLASPTVVYNLAGTYNIKLITSTSCSADTFNSSVIINTAPVAIFSASTTSGVSPLQISFNNTSTGSSPVHYSWNFGDGSVDTTANPLHIFQRSGTYSVCLTVSNKCTEDTQCVIITVISTIHGFIYNDSVCSGGPAIGDTIVLTTPHDNLAAGLSPAISDSNGKFIFNPSEINALLTDSNFSSFVYYSLQTRGTFPLKDTTTRTISQWMAVSPVNLTLLQKPRTIRGVLIGNQFCSLESTAGVPVIIADSAFKRVANISSAITAADGTFSFDAAQVALLDSTQKYSLALAQNATVEPLPIKPRPIDSLISTCVVKEIVMVLEPVMKDTIIIRPAPDTIANQKTLTDSAGNIFVVDTTSTNFTVRKFSSAGTLLWTSNRTGSTNIASAVCHDTKGNIYITGKSWNGSDFDYLTVKVDSSGNTVWALRYDANWNDMATAICTDAAGNVFVAGLTWNGSSYDYTTIRYLQCEPYNSARTQNPPTSTSPLTLNLETIVSIYPNPNSGEMTIKYFIPQNENAQLSIFDLMGRKKAGYLLSGETNQLNISEKDLPEGVYFYTIISNGTKIKQDKIIVIK